MQDDEFGLIRFNDDRGADEIYSATSLEEIREFLEEGF